MLALVYKVVVALERDSTDAQVRTAYRKVSARTHPDRGGDEEHQKVINAAHDEWQRPRPRLRPRPWPRLGRGGRGRRRRRGRHRRHEKLETKWIPMHFNTCCLKPCAPVW